MENDINTAAGKKKVTDDMLPLISAINNEIIKEHYLKKLSETIDISYDALVRQIDKKESSPEEKISVKAQKRDKRESDEEFLLALILQSTDPREMIIKSKDVLHEYGFKTPAIGKIFAEIISVINAKDFDIKSVFKNIPDELLSIFDKCFLMPIPKYESSVDYEKEIIRISTNIRIQYLKEKMVLISKDPKNENKEEEIEGIRKEISDVTSKSASV